MALTSREKHIIDNLKLDIPIVKSISEVGRIFGSHKYDVWIAREIKKDKNLLTKTNDIYSVLDWARKNKPDITRIGFEEALNRSNEWHKALPKKELPEESTDDLAARRIIFKCSDGKHFLLLLTSEELEREGNLMQNCVGSYKGKVKAEHSLIISLRDEDNTPHVTMEIDVKSESMVQLRGKANSTPNKKYLKLIAEFAIYASGCGKTVDEELINLMKSKFE